MSCQEPACFITVGIIVIFFFCTGLDIYVESVNSNQKNTGMVLIVLFGFPLTLYLFSHLYFHIREQIDYRRIITSLRSLPISLPISLPVIPINHYLFPCKHANTKEDALAILRRTIKNEMDPIDLTNFDEMPLSELKRIMIVGEHGYSIQSIRELAHHGHLTSPLNPSIPIPPQHFYIALSTDEHNYSPIS